MSPLNILQATARASTLVVTAGFSVSGLEPMATTRVPPWRGDSVWAAAAPGRSAVTAMPRATAKRARLISISLLVTPTFGDQAPGSAVAPWPGHATLPSEPDHFIDRVRKSKAVSV